MTGQRVRRPTTGGNPCPVPTHYYKVLLRTKQGTTGQPVTTLAADELQCIGFWYEQTTDKAQTPDGCAVSVAEIEAKRVRILRQRAERSEKRLLPGSGAFRATDTEPQRRSGPCTAEAAFFCIPATTGAIRPHSSRGAEAGTDNSAARGQKRGFHWKQPDKTARRSNRGKGSRERQRGERPRFP